MTVAMGNPGGRQHQEEVERLAAALQSQGRVVRLFERCPHVIATKGALLFAVAQATYKNKRTNAGTWRLDRNNTNAGIRRHYKHLDGVHIYQAKGTAAARAANLAALCVNLEAEGWRIFKPNRKCPDAILLSLDGAVVAVEALGVQPGGSRSWTIRAKQTAYGMFDAVHIHRFILGNPATSAEYP